MYPPPLLVHFDKAWLSAPWCQRPTQEVLEPGQGRMELLAIEKVVVAPVADGLPLPASEDVVGRLGS